MTIVAQNILTGADKGNSMKLKTFLQSKRNSYQSELSRERERVFANYTSDRHTINIELSNINPPPNILISDRLKNWIDSSQREKCKIPINIFKMSRMLRH